MLIRVSSLPQYPDCPRRTAAKLWRPAIADAGFDLRESEPSIGASIGTGTHAAAAYDLTERQEGREPNTTESEQRGLQALEDDIAEGVVWDHTSPNLSTAQKQVIRQASAYRRDVVPQTQPVAVEQRYKATTPKGNTLSGQSDLLDQAMLRDTKTGKYQRVNIAQYGGYSLILKSNGLRVDRIGEDFIQRVRIREPQPPVATKEYPVHQAERVAWGILRQMESDLEQFQASGEREAFLANPTSMLCSPEYCPAFGTDFCPESQHSPKHMEDQ